MPETGGFAERRIAPRYVLNMKGTAEVLYRRSLATAYGDPSLKGSDRFMLETINISEGGLMVSFTPEVSEGDIIRLTFVRPDTRTTIEIEAQIQWMRKNQAPIMGKFLAGLMFRNPPKGMLDDLVAYAVSQNPDPVS
jgi:hypothetical protein